MVIILYPHGVDKLDRIRRMADSDSVTDNQTVDVLQNGDTSLSTDEYVHRTCTIINQSA